MLFAIHLVFEVLDLVIELVIAIGDLLDFLWAAAEQVSIQGEVILRDQAADLADLGGVVARILVFPACAQVHEKQQPHHDDQGTESITKFFTDTHDSSSMLAAATLESDCLSLVVVFKLYRLRGLILRVLKLPALHGVYGCVDKKRRT